MRVLLLAPALAMVLSACQPARPEAAKETVSVHVDPAGESALIRSEGREFHVTLGASGPAPLDIPVAEGDKAVSRIKGKDEERITLESARQVKEVIAFYRAAMRGAGFAETSLMDDGAQFSGIWTEPASGRLVYVYAFPQGRGSRIIIVAGRPAGG
jgi:hypothetical protein